MSVKGRLLKKVQVPGARRSRWAFFSGLPNGETMEQTANTRIIFDLFESSGIGFVGLDADNRVVAANRNVGLYLGIEPGELIGHNASIMSPGIRSAEFWAAFPATFYCLAPGPHSLLLIVSRRLGNEHDPVLRRAIIMRPYSLEREFGRMRVCLNNFLAHEVASSLNSIGIASEFITDPELTRNPPTRDCFLTAFRRDIADLNTRFVQMLETAEQPAMPTRVVFTPLDWKALVEDLVAKINGLARERSVALTCNLPPHLPSPSGSYHWLYLGLFAVLAHALRSTPLLAEVTCGVHAGDDRMETVIAAPRSESEPSWPPAVLFPLDDAHPCIGHLAIDDLAVSRSIFLMHGGDLQVAHVADRIEYTVTLPV